VGRCEYSEYPWVTVRGLAEPDSIVAHTFVAHSKGALSIVLARDRSFGCERAPLTCALSEPRQLSSGCACEPPRIRAVLEPLLRYTRAFLSRLYGAGRRLSRYRMYTAECRCADARPSDRH
jgi:hypothetical protein